MSQANHQKFNQKFIACLQSTGRIGKSIFAETLIHWLHFAGISFAGKVFWNAFEKWQGLYDLVFIFSLFFLTTH